MFVGLGFFPAGVMGLLSAGAPGVQQEQMTQNGQPRHVSSLNQFAALLHKNVLLLAASRGSLFKCFSVWGSLVFRLAVPAVFFTIMLLPKYYIPVRVC